MSAAITALEGVKEKIECPSRKMLTEAAGLSGNQEINTVIKYLKTIEATANQLGVEARAGARKDGKSTRDVVDKVSKTKRTCLSLLDHHILVNLVIDAERTKLAVMFMNMIKSDCNIDTELAIAYGECIKRMLSNILETLNSMSGIYARLREDFNLLASATIEYSVIHE